LLCAALKNKFSVDDTSCDAIATGRTPAEIRIDIVAFAYPGRAEFMDGAPFCAFTSNPTIHSCRANIKKKILDARKVSL
jgi:hypothetical protein